MRALILVAGAALSLSACGSNDSAANLDTVSNENAIMDQNMTTGTTMPAGMDGTNASVGMDANAAGGMDQNVATNAATEANMMAKDLNTNDRDTNLANGM